MYVTHDGRFSSQRHIESAIIDRVVPDFVEAQPDIHWSERRNRSAVLLVEIADERSGGYRVVTHPAFEEVAAHGGLGEERHLRPRVKRIELRENLAKVREIPGVVSLARLELHDCQMD